MTDAQQAKAAHEDALMSLPHVVGVGTGRDDETGSDIVIVWVDRNDARTSGGRLKEEVRQQALDELLNPEVPKSNVIGFGHGITWTDGLPTGEEATLVFVTQKLPESGLSERDVVPRRMADGSPTDVVALGYLTAQQLIADPARPEHRSGTSRSPRERSAAWSTTTYPAQRRHRPVEASGFPRGSTC